MATAPAPKTCTAKRIKTAQAVGFRTKPNPNPKPEKTARLTITSKNYSSWSLRGWLSPRFAGLPFDENALPPDDPSARAEILLLSSSIRVPCLDHQGVSVWDTLAIGEYLNEVCPQAALLPSDIKARAHCRAICGEMHSGFTALRSSLSMNLHGHFPKFKVWSRAQADIDSIVAILEKLSPNLRWAVFVRRAAQHRRCHVRSSLYPFCHVRYSSRSSVPGVLRFDVGPARNGRVA
jgi:glutathione S-transferase